MNHSFLKVLYVSSEITPFAKVGGLADVAASLPKALQEIGCEVKVVMPKYRSIDEERYGLSKMINSFTVSTGEKLFFPSVYEGKLLDSDVPLYFIDEPEIFGRENLYGYHDDTKRYTFFSKACLEACKAMEFQPDIINCNDWHNSFIPLLLKSAYRDDPFFKSTKSVLSLHNMQYQGIAPTDILEYAQIPKNALPSLQIDSENNDIDCLLQGIINADMITTVSESYAREILSPEYAYGLEYFLNNRKDNIQGIINGLDVESWNPESDEKIFKKYSLHGIKEGKAANKRELQRLMGLPVNDNIPVIGIVTRLVEQKGIDLVAMIREKMFCLDLQCIILGSGEAKYEKCLENLQRSYPKKCALNLLFDDEIARKIYAGSDFFLMPSKFEPCGLGQMIAMRYGTIPLVRKTGGLADTVEPYIDDKEHGDGFVFEQFIPQELLQAVTKAVATYKNKKIIENMRKKIMQKDFSWKQSAKKYLEVYKKNPKIIILTLSHSLISTLSLINPFTSLHVYHPF